MAITNGYITLAEFKLQFKIVKEPDTDRDAQIEQAIEGACRWIDEHCNRRFWKATETRYYTPEWYDLLFVDDLLSVTTLKADEDADRVYEITWATTDYDLEPDNAPFDVPPAPYTMIRVTDNGDHSFPVGVRRGIEITGVFGWADAVPADVKQAAYLMANRLWARKDAALGVAGATAFGTMTVKTPEDKDIERLLYAFVKRS